VSIWFQEDLPFPGVDLSKLRPKKGDTFPAKYIKEDMNHEFKRNYVDVFRPNFAAWGEYESDTRLFEECLTMMD
jgi:hypothetical protein